MPARRQVPALHLDDAGVTPGSTPFAGRAARIPARHLAREHTGWPGSGAFPAQVLPAIGARMMVQEPLAGAVPRLPDVRAGRGSVSRLARAVR